MLDRTDTEIATIGVRLIDDGHVGRSGVTGAG